MKLNNHLAFIKFLGLILVLLTIFVFVHYAGVIDKVRTEGFREGISDYGFFAPLAFIVVYILSAIAFVPVSIFTVAAGIIFGSFKGVLYVIIAASIASSISFFLSRKLGSKYVQKIVGEKLKGVEEYNQELKKRGFGTVLFIRFMPFLPFNIVNLGLGLSNIKFSSFLIGTIIGIIPGTFLLAFFGAAVTELNLRNIIISAILGVLVFVAYLIYLKLWKRHLN